MGVKMKSLDFILMPPIFMIKGYFYDKSTMGIMS